MQAKRPFYFSIFWLLLTLLSAHAQTFTVLHTFHYSDGFSPIGQLLLDDNGNIYGTTSSGGTPQCAMYAQGCGTVFKLSENGTLVGLHSFSGTDGMGPMAGVLRDAGNLYGTTTFGGTTTQDCPLGCGVVFRLDTTGKETVLYAFQSTKTGYTPEALLVGDSSGLYGTTIWGGIQSNGVVFKVGHSGETVLYTFEGGATGGEDYPGVIWGAPGYLFGIAGYGLYSNGVLFEVDVATGEETVLYNFTGSSEGVGQSLLVEDSTGSLYGTTQAGGNMQIYECGDYEGCGVVYKLSSQSGTWTETVLYTFGSQPNLADGARPLYGPLVRDEAGNLYGTTYFGGLTNCDGEGEGCGIVFKLDPSGNESVLHTFTGGADGAFPWAGLTMDKSGNLYGAASAGGDLNCQPKYHGCGVIFKITP